MSFHNIDFIIKQFKIYMYNECYNIIKTIENNYDIEENISDKIDDKIFTLNKIKIKKEKKKKYKYIDVYIEYLNGNKVYIDDNQFIYDNLKNPKILGFINKDGNFQEI
jgi:hypothetical protein